MDDVAIVDALLDLNVERFLALLDGLTDAELNRVLELLGGDPDKAQAGARAFLEGFDRHADAADAQPAHRPVPLVLPPGWPLSASVH